ARGADRRQPVMANEDHPDELVTPGVPIEDIGLGKGMAHAAHGASLFLIALRRRCGLGRRRVNQRRRPPDERNDDDARCGDEPRRCAPDGWHPSMLAYAVAAIRRRTG